MSIGPVVLRPRPVPPLAILAAIVAVVFVVLGLVLDRWMAGVAAGIAIVFVLAGFWLVLQARRSVVMIDTHQFIVKAGGRQQTFERTQIDTIDLSRLRGQVRFTDGTSVTLPLVGDQLVEAGILLSPSVAET